MEQRRSATLMSMLLLVGPMGPSGFVPERPAQSLPHAMQATAVGKQAQAPEAPSGECPRTTLHLMSLGPNIDELAGQDVSVLSARVLRVFEPGAFLIEPALRYSMDKGLRDRVVVLINGGSLRVPSEVLVGSTVTVLGNARTLLAARVSPEVPWPRTLDRDLVKHLEVRAAIVASSVQTPEGIELAQAGPGGSRPARGC